MAACPCESHCAVQGVHGALSLFLASGFTVSQAGPLGAVIAYTLGALMIYCVMTCLGALAVAGVAGLCRHRLRPRAAYCPVCEPAVYRRVLRRLLRHAATQGPRGTQTRHNRFARTAPDTLIHRVQPTFPLP
ncbi:hypothetical protein G3435_23140 [Pseudomonas sp. MAFF212428]|uniref:Amino acid permease/ SLC12A domain-containing protein n=1 Tax=Pseudomonas brassicae TaxID=2708063 RepID=A0A6B3NW38_9PSED|nr:hypothetical protein [Pseudomonas brassicae]NER66226.1 hypothetical protein [Pseudomonas brassicae]